MTTVFEYVPLVVRNYLSDELGTEWSTEDGTHRVATEVPNPRPANLITITTAPVYGPQNLVLSTRRLIIQCWNSSELVAGRLAEDVRGILFAANRRHVPWIRSVEIVGEPARFDDPDSNTPRFQLTADVLVRAKP